MNNYHWLSPYRADKNLGKALNDAITQLSAADDDFIIHCDQDVCFLLPDTKAHIMEILSATDYAVLGCMTNRLGLRDQLVPGMFNVDKIHKHIEMADGLWKAEGGRVFSTDNVAAMVMCFKVSTWRAVGGFQENRINFDSLFCHFARKRVGKLGIMAGIMVLHLYRYMSEDPQNSYKHLEL